MTYNQVFQPTIMIIIAELPRTPRLQELDINETGVEKWSAYLTPHGNASYIMQQNKGNMTTEDIKNGKRAPPKRYNSITPAR